jgi:catechol 2,3-dioxygenase-like lactoylglutathione lyase family enzyme
MQLQVTAIMLGVADVERSKRFYRALGGRVVQDHPGFARLELGEGSSALALYPWDAAAQDAGVPPEGSGFRGASFHHIVGSKEEVDEIVGSATAAGGTITKHPEGTDWGYSGFFSDPDGYLWKVATGG